MICAARALAEHASQKAAAAAAARSEASNPTYFPGHEGASAIRLCDAPVKKSGGHPDKRVLMKTMDAAAAASAVSVTRLRETFSALCRQKLVSPLASSEFDDLLDRVIVSETLFSHSMLAPCSIFAS